MILNNMCFVFGGGRWCSRGGGEGEEEQLHIDKCLLRTKWQVCTIK